MLNNALRSLQMIKLAKRSGFYYLAGLDPKADAYDEVKNEIYRAQEAVANSLDPATGATRYTVANAPDSIFAKAIEANEALAKARRSAVAPYMYTGMGIGGTIGAGLGGTAGYFGSKALGFGRKGKIISTIGGTLLGGALGANIGGKYNANRYVNSEAAPTFSDGTSVLVKLDKDIKDKFGEGTYSVNSHVAGNAVETAKRRKAEGK